MIRYVFLDLDDTLFDFRMAERIALKRTLAEMGITPTDAIAARYSAINDAFWKQLEKGTMTRAEIKLRRFEQLLAELGSDADPERTRVLYEKKVGEGHYFLDGAEELLQTLHSRYALYLVSNGTTAVQKGRIASADIEKYFQAIYLSEEVGHVKPERAFFDACFGEIRDFDRSAAIILGDSLTSDMQGGINAGIRTCWFNPAKKPRPTDAPVPDFEIDTLSQFPKLLETL